jgi:hypothetical protein
MDAFSWATGIVSICSIGIQIIQVLDGFIKTWKEVPENVQSFHAELQRDIRILESSKSLWELQGSGRQSHTSLESPAVSMSQCMSDQAFVHDWIDSCKNELEKLSNALTISPKCSIARGWKRVKTALRSDSLNRSMENLHRYCDQINRQVNVSTLAKLSESLEELRQIRDVQNKESHKKILSWLSTFNHVKRHEDLVEKWHPGTVQWIFDNDGFLDWSTGITSGQDETHSSTPSTPILWCYGPRKFSPDLTSMRLELGKG